QEALAFLAYLNALQVSELSEFLDGVWDFNVFPQQTPIGALIRRGGLVPKVAKAQRQPVSAAQPPLFDTVMDFFVHSVKKLVIVQYRSDSLTLVRETGKNQTPF
ncbi:hypothetical protein ACQKDL_24155, partial [Pseudomonas bubulae]|uniref:hypothetical protein n=1 Tax=Pseudomonas bubulae TaxID=2316085 RepID=UPI003CFEBB4C